jgi:hypothetical protein
MQRETRPSPFSIQFESILWWFDHQAEIAMTIAAERMWRARIDSKHDGAGWW